ncbi:MAG: ferrous iron transport protein [Verrucomicrobiota bacterium]|jgi:Fe2+ transport system protein FeoA|nr:ferrous iron transport protein [Verrucomicrobiota bacterium]MDK2963070.1 ferrous iron transport protein [Verrucomicrobiota bacterium]
MFKSFFGKGPRHRHRACNGTARHGGQDRCRAHPLEKFTQGVEVTVISNSDRKTLEMGLCTGAAVRVVENRPGDANMVVAAGDGRYIISKESAAKIRVR